MCGITGIVDLAGRRPIDESVLRAMNGRIEPSRSRRRRLSLRARRRPRPSPPVHHRPRGRQAAALQRRSLGRRHVQRRDLQLQGDRGRAAQARPHLPHALRHRSDRARVGGVGRASASSASTACSRSRCGTSQAAPVHRARSPGRQAAVLRDPAGRAHGVRLGAEGAAGAPARCRAASIRRPSRNTSRSATCPIRRRSIATCKKLEPGAYLSIRRG